MQHITRKTFLGAGLGAIAVSTLPHARALGANNDLRIGIVGVGSNVKIGGKGRKDAADFRKIPGVRVVALCDCDEENLARGVADAEKAGQRVKTFRDMRALLDDPEIDAISITLPNHWHALAAIWACQAGKDVFMQKPGSHNIFEGRKTAEAADKYGRVVMITHGPRSSQAFGEAFAFARSGGLGKPRYIRGINYKPRESIGKVAGPQPIPRSCDYDLWCGPAPKKPLHREYLHYDWHWFWDTGNGDLGNMGIHFMDACRWASGQEQLPPRTISIGGRFGYEDDGETPNTLITYFDYAPIPIVFEVRGLPEKKEYMQGNWGKYMDKFRGAQYGAFVECDDGYVFEDKAYDRAGNVVKEFKTPSVDDKQNFADAVRKRRPRDLIATAIGGHYSASLVHLANISCRLGTGSKTDEIRERLHGNAEFGAAFDRFAGHLEANGIDLERTPAALGPLLELDPATERFTGTFAADAAKLRTRDYRTPFVVPEKV